MTCCFGTVEGESCGWPKGTVRACVTLITIPIGFIASIAMMIILIVQGQYKIALGINSVIWGVIGTIIGHYFGTKQAEGAAKMILQSEHELIESRNLELTRNHEIARNQGINRGLNQEYIPVPNQMEDNNDVIIEMEEEDN